MRLIKKVEKDIVPLGFYIETKSNFNGKDILLIFTNLKHNSSANTKIGAGFIQTWILEKDEDPYQASLKGNDQSICGNCPQRLSEDHSQLIPTSQLKKGSCYVRTRTAPLSIYKAFNKNRYTKLNLKNKKHLQLFENRNIRLGAYGDPAAIPIDFWNEFFSKTRINGSTGYTHAWKESWAKAYQPFLMASVESPLLAKEALQKGWRYFRVRTQQEDLIQNEFECPASVEQGYRLQCEDCLACFGTKKNYLHDEINKQLAANPVVIAHGFRAPKVKFEA